MTSQGAPFDLDSRMLGPELLDDLVVEGVAVGQVHESEAGWFLEEVVDGLAGHQPRAQDVQLPVNFCFDMKV